MNGRASKRDRRRADVEIQRNVWSDDVFGLRFDQLASGRPVFRWTFDTEPAINLVAVERVQQFLAMATEEWVLALRADGDSWDDVGLVLGVTGEAARRRFAPLESDYAARVGDDS